MKTYNILTESLPPALVKLARMYDLTYDNGSHQEVVSMDEGKFFVVDKQDYPRLVVLDGKLYDLAAPSRRNQDASDLPLYDEVLDLASSGLIKNSDTCNVIIDIQQHLIQPILFQIVSIHILETNDDETVRHLRGRILRGKFNAVTIWREGKLRKE